MTVPNINTPEYWDAAWRKHHQAYIKDPGRLALAQEAAARVSGNVLEIGGGCSAFASLVSRITVLDFSVFALAMANRNGHNAIWCDLAVYEEKVFGEFDWAVCLDVLEHLDEPERAIRCARLNAPKALFAVPNNTMGPGSCREHVRIYTEEQLADALSEWPYCKITTVQNRLLAEVRCE